MLAPRYPYLIAGQPEDSGHDLPVVDKFTGEVATRAALASPEAIERAIAAAHGARGAMERLPPYERQAILERCVQQIRSRAEELAQVLCIEAGKTLRDARGEVTRMIDTFKAAAEEATRIEGETLCLEISPRAAGYRGFTRKVPVGVCSLITPFNFPLNLVAHKVAPAIAAGCPFLVKPSEKTPVSALILGEILAGAGLPPGSFSVLVCRVEDAGPLVDDPRIALLSFTGSSKVGWSLKARAGRKKVTLELGGNAACIVDEDQLPHLDHVVERLLFGAYAQAGQSCISVQRILVHRSLLAPLREALVRRVRTLRAGDPRDESTALGPMIDEAAAARLQGWIDEARAAGAVVLCGGGRSGALLEATLLEGVPEHLPLHAEEAFGPVALLEPFATFDEALERVNRSQYGLQAGVFTGDLRRALRAWEELEVGGVVVGDVPSFRVDTMPYGGVKGSGLGREGVRYAIEDMSETRLLVVAPAR
jgi:acyl-CoA reductase-like NAD-dependent aldehyde dehydrogenase